MIKDFKQFKPELGVDSWAADNARVIGRCVLGDDASVWFGAVIRGDVNFIEIGKRTNIQDLSVIHVTADSEDGANDGFPTIVGNDVTIGHKVMLHGCRIGNAALIGMSATILDGAEIGKESLVAAGSVVTPNKKFPPGSLIMGTPAKVVKQLSKKEIKQIYESAEHYVKYKNQYLKKE